MYRKNCFVCGRRFVNAKILSEHLETHFPGIDFEPINLPIKILQEDNGMYLTTHHIQSDKKKS